MYGKLLSFSILALMMKMALAVQPGPAESASILDVDQTTKANKTDLGDRHEKFISLFTVVRFSNDACVSSGNLSGTCLTSAECSAGGGTSSGTCASGFGVCCVFSFSTCGSMTSRNCTYFTTPTLSTSGQSCMYMINKCSSDVCQMRIDFLSFQIAQPNKYVDATAPTTAERTTATNCIQDQFTILNAATAVSPICGLNTGQHMYVDVANTNSIKFSFSLSSSNTAPNPANPTRYWNIKVTQIPCCSSNNLAPAGCLQYYTDLSGTITSFNYDTTTVTNSFHLANQDYAICFRMEQNYCTICYTVCDTINNPGSQFDLSGGGAAGATADTAGTGTTACFADYVVIPGAYDQGTTSTSTVANTMAADRLCGQRFNADGTATTHTTVCSSTKPFRFNFKTNADEATSAAGAEATTTGYAGFCLRYSQLPCSSSG